MINCTSSVHSCNQVIGFPCRQQLQAYCGGQRSYQRRTFVRGSPPFIPLVLDHFATKGILADISQLPPDIKLEGHRY